jgi:hypothetical protein
MSINKTKQWMMAIATLVVQCPLDGPDDDTLKRTWQSAIDATDVLRRVGETTARSGESVRELHCEVEYGPVKGTEGDMRRHLERQLAAITATVNGTAQAVFNVKATELSSAEQFNEVIANLEMRANDINVPLAVRKQLQNIVARLRSGKNAGRVRRVA